MTDTKRVPMSEVGEFIRGRRFTKADMVDEGIPCMHYGEIYTSYGTSASEALSHVREALRPSLRFAQNGDVVIAAVGETVEDVGKGVAWLGDTDVAIHDDCFLYRSSVLDPRYVAYYLQTAEFAREKSKFVARAKVKRLSADSLGRLGIPVPPIEEQLRVVAGLDRLHAQVLELSLALKAEIDGRERQYAHYRDGMFRVPGESL